jgi:hypothetical protein
MDRAPEGSSLSEITARYGEARRSLAEALGAEFPASLSPEDRLALEIMRGSLDKDLREPDAPAAATPAPDRGADCAYDAQVLSRGDGGLKTLTERMYDCFGRAAGRLPFEGKTLDRLTIMSSLVVTDDADRRRRLFLALEPVWRAVNGDGGDGSPYRRLIHLAAATSRPGGGPWRRRPRPWAPNRCDRRLARRRPGEVARGHAGGADRAGLRL